MIMYPLSMDYHAFSLRHREQSYSPPFFGAAIVQASLTVLCHRHYYRKTNTSSSIIVPIDMAECSQPVRGPRRRPFDHGSRTSVSLPNRGDIILVNINVARISTSLSDITGPPSSELATTTDSSASDLAGRTRSKAEGEIGSYQLHPCIVLGAETKLLDPLNDCYSWSLTVLPCRSFSGVSDPAAYVAAMPPALNYRHIPLPPPPGEDPPPTPDAFGDPIEVSLVPRRCTWIVAEVRTLEMGINGGVSVRPSF